MNARIALNAGFGLSRVAFGLAAATAPGKIGGTWIGEDASRRGVVTTSLLAGSAAVAAAALLAIDMYSV